MDANISSNTLKLFANYIEEKCGIYIPQEKAYLIETRLLKMLYELKLSNFEELYTFVIQNKDYKISEELIDAITTNETSWFRDKTPWEILGEIYMPKFIQSLKTGEKNKIRIWSTAASSGQEAYSIAMFIDSWILKNDIKDVGSNQFEIIATDISHSILEMAKNGRYDAITIMRGLDSYYKGKYFRKDGSTWEIDDRIKSMVDFKHFNLKNSFIVLGKFDVIFCRYVLIYFPNELKEEIAMKLFNDASNDAVLFIGASEFFDSIEKYFHRSQAEKGTYYIREVRA